MLQNKIIISGINHHNFKNVNLELQKNELIVFTGPSGSGKSTLVIDIIYAESQRKFIESLPFYARQFIGLPEKADIQSAEGLTPAIAIDQKTSSSNRRSTVGTMSEIYEYVRTLYATVGIQHCPNCLIPITKMTAEDIKKKLENTVFSEEIILYIIISAKNIKETENAMSEFIFRGYTLFIINNIIQSLRTKEEVKKAIDSKKEQIGVVFFKGILNEKTQIVDIIEQMLSYKHFIYAKTETKNFRFSNKFCCTTCFHEYSFITPRLFSFNLPTGACLSCKGIGTSEQELRHTLQRDFDYFLIASQNLSNTCSSCQGGRLNKQALSVFIEQKNIYDFCLIPLSEYSAFFEKIKNSTGKKRSIIEPIFEEIEKRITLLIDLGIGYLHLARESHTLSGGEAQRIRLANQLGSGLTGVTYILDEPSIGLHQRDNIKLISIMKKLRDLGNTVLVIEHDEETMLAADTLVDIGPGAGTQGGKIIFQGNPKLIEKAENSITGAYLTKKKIIHEQIEKRKIQKYFTIREAKKNNLKNITVDIPLNVITAITGVSGSGKSTLIFDEMIPKMEEYLKILKEKSHHEDFLKTEKNFEALIAIDQSPLGRTSRSTIGTYLGLFDYIRELFAQLAESKAAGYTLGSFSFNTGNQRCQKCLGKGECIVNLDPLPAITVPCESCEGKRYTKSLLKIKYQGKNIFEVLQLTVAEAIIFFRVHKKIVNQLQALNAVGLGYITLDQSSDTFSGGEAQRVKLAFELNRRKKNTVYVLDEPTTGLHFQDIALLITIFQKLVDKNNTVIIIEHNIPIISSADYIIDMGPEGGDLGGYVLASGTPEELKKNPQSITGKFL